MNEVKPTMNEKRELSGSETNIEIKISFWVHKLGTVLCAVTTKRSYALNHI